MPTPLPPIPLVDLVLKMKEIPGERPEPNSVLSDLRISFQFSTARKEDDTWLFLNCENLPTTLPPYLDKIALGKADIFSLLPVEKANAYVFKRKMHGVSRGY